MTAAALASALVLGATASSASALETFRFAWPSAINSGVAPLVFAEQLGLFEREGMTLDIVVLTGSGVIIPQLRQGTIDAAYSGLEPVIISHQPDTPDLGVKFVYNFIPRSIWEMAVLASSDITDITDLEGRTIGVLGLGSSNVLGTRAILQSRGVDPESVTFQAVGVGAAAFEALRSGEIDVLNLFDTAHQRLELAGTPLRRLELPADFTRSSHGVSVSIERFEERPEFFGRFGRGVAQANLACEANIDACIRAYWAAYPELAPTRAQEAATLEAERAVVSARLANLLSVDGPFGAFSDADWASLVGALQAGGLVTDPDVPFELYYTDELVEMFNDFDREALIALAKAAQ
ncbi:MAG: ABC transporter substrate-binding protein [Rhodobacteraceae bacterium]|nr:ABC transporter substrate-binding protein [Paracoccaceae bacterium]